MRIFLPMRSRRAIVLREHDVRGLVVSQDHEIVRIKVVAGEDHYEGWIVTDKDVLDLLRETDTYVTVKTVFASKQGRTKLKRGAPMQTKRNGNTGASAIGGNLAFADESLGVVQEPKAMPLSPVLAVVPGMLEEDSEAHALASATGIIVGIGLSTMLWPFIILVVFWIR